MADNGRGQNPGEDVALAFDMGFDDDGAAAGRHPERTFGAAPEERGSRRPAAAPPPPDIDDDFEAMPEPGQEFGAPVSAARDDFDDLGNGGAAHAVSDFDDEHAQNFGQSDPVEDFDTPHEDEHSEEHFGAEAGDDLEDPAVQHDAHSDEDEEASLRADHDDEAEVAPEVAGRSLLSRALVPAAALGGIAVAGWFAWSYVSPLLFDTAPVQQTQVQQPRLQMQPQSALPPGKLPPLPSGGQARPPAAQQLAPQPALQQQAAVQPGLAPLQPTPQPLPQRPLQQAAPAAAQPVAPQAPAAAMSPPAAQQIAAVQPQPTPQATSVPTGMNRPSDDAMSKIFGAIAEISNDVKGLGVRIDGIEKSGKDMRADLSRRMDDIDAKTKSGGNGGIHVASADPTATIAPKASTGSAAPSAPALSKKPTKPAPTAEEDAPPRAERSAKHSRRAKLERRRSADPEPEDRAYAGDEPPAKPRVIGDYKLNGVSEVGGRSSALIRSKRGLEEVTVGQTLAGGGEVRSIRKSGGSWVVVTSRGVIVE